MKKIYSILLLTIISNAYYTQNCGLKNPSFETYNACPTLHSQFYTTNSWYNPLPTNVSTPDYFNYSCGFVQFNTAGSINVRPTNDETEYTNCGRAGIFLNYNDGVQNPRYKEYIGQNFDIISGVQYTFTVDIHKSTHNSTDDLEKDLAVYGYTGFLPASHTDYCINGAVLLGTIPRASITTSINRLSITFTASGNYDNIIIGPECTGTDAANVGYVYIDRVDLVSNDNNTLNPIIENYKFSNNLTCKCSYKAPKDVFYIKGTSAPAGATALWGQNPSNPETVTFTQPNNDSTGITGVGHLTAGNYQFTYSFTKGGCTIIDTININVIASSLATASAGPDIIVCNGNNDYGAPHIQNRRDINMNATPSATVINTNGYTTWWSMIRQDGSEWVFENSCIPFDGDDEGDVDGSGIGSSTCGSISGNFSSNSPTARFRIKNPQDSIYFIWHVQDSCDKTIVDTVLVVMNDIDITSPNRTLCPGIKDTLTIRQENSPYLRNLADTSYLSFEWSVTPTPPGFYDTNQLNNAKIIISSDSSTTYSVRIDVTDNRTGCSWHDITRVRINSVTGDSINAGDNIIVCNGNNDPFDEERENFRYIEMNAYPSRTVINSNNYQTYWSMIRDDGSEWIFTNPCVPFDGSNEGRVRVRNTTTSPSRCGNIQAGFGGGQDSHGPQAWFDIINPQDTIFFIWNMQDPCGAFQKDTMMVVMNDVDLDEGDYYASYRPLVTCPGTYDTILITQNFTNTRRKLFNNPNLSFTWSSNPSAVDFLDTNNIDSVLLVVSGDSTQEYGISIHVTDNSSGCSWYDTMVIYVDQYQTPIVSAGNDRDICNTTLSNYRLNMNATPTRAQYGDYEYESWWSMIRADGSEWVFSNPCGIPFDGANEGTVRATSPQNSSFRCGNPWPQESHSPDARFRISNWGDYTFIWHVYDACLDSVMLDTINISWGYNEPIVNAGPDQAPPSTCNAVELQGNLSAASAGNTGCYGWRQISGIDTIDILDSTSNLAYLLNLDSLSPGVYEMEYRLGCEPCIKYDTMSLTVGSGITSGILDVTTNQGALTSFCIGDSIEITGSLAYGYAFYSNGINVQPFSFDSTYTLTIRQDTQEIIVLATDFSQTCFNNSDTTLLFFGVPCITPDTITTCVNNICVNTFEMNLFGGYDTLATCSGNLTTTQGGSIIINDTCITHIPPLGIWTNDSICVILCDTSTNICDTTLIIFCYLDTNITIYCNDTNAYLNTSGIAPLDTSMVLDSIVSSGYAVDSVWLSKYVVTCSNIGLDSVWVYARNIYGEIDSCKSYLNVYDTIDPVISCNNPTLYLNNSGVITVDTSSLISSMSDNCEIDSVWTNLISNTLTCVSIGNISVTVYALDINNNIDSCTSTVMISDTLAPNIICQPTTVYIDNTGTMAIDTSGIITSVTDNCSVDSVWIKSNDTLLTCTNIGNYTVTVYATDSNNNIDSCSTILTVSDTLPPTVICQPATIYLNSNGRASMDTSGLITSINDNCSLDSVWIKSSDTLLTCADTGSYNATIYVRDFTGNIDSCIANLTVLDTVSPTIACLPPTLYLNNLGQVIIDTSLIISNITGNCSIDSVWTSLANDTLSCDSIGTISVTVYIMGGSNVDSCTSLITILDTTAPTLLCQPAIIYLDSNGDISVTTTALITNLNDNCSVDSVWIKSSDTLLSCSDTGIYNMTIYAKDPSNNIDSCISVLTIRDTLLPNIVCQPATIYLNNNGFTVIDTNGLITISSDNCSLDSVWIKSSDTLLTCTDTGSYNATIYVRDFAGNIDSCIANLTVLDTISPTIACLPATLYLNNLGQVIIDTSLIVSNITGNCSIDSVWTNLANDTLSCDSIGTISVTIYIMGGGNIDSCTTTITIVDTIAPIIHCQPAIIYLDSNGEISVTTTGLISSLNDNCNVDSVWIKSSDTLLSCADTGVYIATIYALDFSGNIDSCNSLLTIIDTISPNIMCKDTSIIIGSTGSITIDTSFVLTNSYDNCSIDSVWLSKYTYTCTDTGFNSVVIYGRDYVGNIDSCSSIIEVRGNIPPTSICKDTTIYLSAIGDYLIDSSYINDNSTVNCSSITGMRLSTYYFTCSNIGQNQVTLTIYSSSRDSSSCNSSVTVLDTITPIISCLNDTLIAINNTCEFIIPDFSLGLIQNDNCDSNTIQYTQTPNPGTLIDVSNSNNTTTQSITILSQDQASNSTSCSFDLIITCDATIFIPQFISPNGDGLNDAWIIDDITQYPNNEVNIYNRWGERIYQKNNYDNTWKGEINSSNTVLLRESGKAVSGTYFYTVYIESINKMFTGYLQIR